VSANFSAPSRQEGAGNAQRNAAYYNFVMAAQAAMTARGKYPGRQFSLNRRVLGYGFT
jgi:hypothetical protein